MSTYMSILNIIELILNLKKNLTKNINMSVNHFSYADDMAILSPSASGLQKLLNICSSYAIEHDIIYNVKKTQCMVVPSTKFKLENIPRVF